LEMMRRRVSLRFCLFVLGLFPAATFLAAERLEPTASWPRFRGTAAAGQGGADRLPAEWSSVGWNWTADLPGQGHGSPVIHNGRIFNASADEAAGVRFLMCHDLLNGQLLWQRDFPGLIERHHQQNSSASGTVTVDDRGLYWLWGTSENVRLEALTHEGESRWAADLGPFVGPHGFGGSPVVWQDLVIVPLEQDEAGAIIGIDAATGAERWRLAREGVGKAAYATPLVLSEIAGGPQVICTSNAHGIYAIDPATGRVLWEQPCFPRRTVASPIAAGSLLVGTCGNGGGNNLLVALQPPTAGKTAEVVYEVSRSVAPYVPTPLYSQGRLYLWGDKGVVTCLDAATGDVRWKGRVGGNFSASPLAVGGRILNVSSDGEIVVLDDADTFTVRSRVSLDEETRATPAIAGGWFVLRSAGRLRALRLQPPAG
jgi:outer membrane protein assembly factor BamB